VRQFGLWHERAITLHDEGERIEGYDRLVRSGKSRQPAQHQFDIRFHLHPVVRATREDHRSVHLMTDQGESWLFTANSRRCHAGGFHPFRRHRRSGSHPADRDLGHLARDRHGRMDLIRKTCRILIFRCKSGRADRQGAAAC
jgi:hypothetical protein